MWHKNDICEQVVDASSIVDEKSSVAFTGERLSRARATVEDINAILSLQKYSTNYFIVTLFIYAANTYIQYFANEISPHFNSCNFP